VTVATLEDVLERMEVLLTEVEQLDEPVRSQVFELLDGVDAVHRMALERLGAELGDDRVSELRSSDAAIAWLLDAYSVGVDERRAADEALETVRPYVHSHGGEVELLDAHQGVVRVRLSGACSGCTASAVTLQEGVVEALREHFPGFTALEVEEDEAAAKPHPPPGPTLVEIRRKDGR
jgi:Fe-S cluster biogenesis protein NfuA